jgi:hypothetical protein
MTINYDEKGKYYTDIISKVAVEARIQTTNHFIEGKIHVCHDTRLKDELDRDEPFLAVTEARIFNTDHLLLFRTQFIAVQRNQVIWITTEEDIEKGES